MHSNILVTIFLYSFEYFEKLMYVLKTIFIQIKQLMIIYLSMKQIIHLLPTIHISYLQCRTLIYNVWILKLFRCQLRLNDLVKFIKMNNDEVKKKKIFSKLASLQIKNVYKNSWISLKILQIAIRYTYDKSFNSMMAIDNLACL